MMKRYSKQREVIMKSLKNRCDHPTADLLYWDVKKELPEIGIATIYRNLAELHEAGEILKLKTLNGGPDRFDGNNQPHIHMECTSCEEVYDVFPEHELYSRLKDDIKKLGEIINAECTDTAITIHGICAECKKKNKEEKKDESVCM